MAEFFLWILLLLTGYIVLSTVILKRIYSQVYIIPQIKTADTYVGQDQPEAASVFINAVQEYPEYSMTLEELEEENYWDSLDLLALCVMAEAEGESELGKRLVIDAVLNRVAHPDFPDTIEEVISAPKAFTSYHDGRMERVEPTQEIYQLIAEELMEQTNYEVLWFTAGEWPKYGERLFQEGNHYFCG